MLLVLGSGGIAGESLGGEKDRGASLGRHHSVVLVEIGMLPAGSGVDVAQQQPEPFLVQSRHRVVGPGELAGAFD